MKVSFGGKVRKINSVPTSMAEFKRIVQQKFMNLQLAAPGEAQAQTLSRILDDSELNGDNSEFAKLIDDSINQRNNEAEESKAGGRRGKRDKKTIDFSNSRVFYEDSEGDFNVISEDEDLADATTYILQHNQKALKCTIVPKQFYEDLRHEQMRSDLN